MLKLRRQFISVVVGVIIFAMNQSVLAGNDFVYGELRVDLPQIKNAGAYDLLLYAATDTRPLLPADFTTAWLGIELANGSGTGGAQFSQIGLITRPDGLRWFVYAEPGVTCHRGTPNYGSWGCQGAVGDIVAVGNYYRVELRRISATAWHAMIYDTNSTPYVLATISSSSATIYRASAVTEQGYSSGFNPHTPAYYYHRHPRYYISAPYIYADWPQSETGITTTPPKKFSEIYTWASDGFRFCPVVYGATPNIAGDERSWFAGTGGSQCSYLLFWPKIFLPLIQR